MTVRMPMQISHGGSLSMAKLQYPLVATRSTHPARVFQLTFSLASAPLLPRRAVGDRDLPNAAAARPRRRLLAVVGAQPPGATPSRSDGETQLFESRRALRRQ